MADPITVATLAGVTGFALYALGLKQTSPAPPPPDGGGTDTISVNLAIQGPGTLCETTSGLCAPGALHVAPGAMLTLVARPSPGASFAGWLTAGGLQPGTSTVSEAFYSSGVVTAVFTISTPPLPPPGTQQVPITLQVSPNGGAGNLVLSGPSEQASTFNQSSLTVQGTPGDSVILQAIPASGWQFDHFDIGGTYSNASDGQGNGMASFTISGPLTVVAYFTQLSAPTQLYLTASGPGQVCDLSGNCARNGATQPPYAAGTQVTLIASPDPGPFGGLINYLVQSVTIDGVSYSNPGQISGGHFGANGLDWVFPVTIGASGSVVSVSFG